MNNLAKSFRWKLEPWSNKSEIFITEINKIWEDFESFENSELMNPSEVIFIAPLLDEYDVSPLKEKAETSTSALLVLSKQDFNNLNIA